VKARSSFSIFALRTACALLRPLHSKKLKTLAARNRDNVRLHLGAGGVNFNGWINIDYSFRVKPDVALNLTRPLPLKDNCAAFIYTEDFLEHLDYEDGRALLRECYRLLAPGGVLRVLTPDLNIVARQYLERDPAALAWYAEQFGAKTPAQMLNIAMRGMEHRFLYDAETLSTLLSDAGFDPRPAALNESDSPELRNLDQRKNSLVFDAVKR